MTPIEKAIEDLERILMSENSDEDDAVDWIEQFGPEVCAALRSQDSAVRDAYVAMCALLYPFTRSGETEVEALKRLVSPAAEPIYFDAEGKANTQGAPRPAVPEAPND